MLQYIRITLICKVINIHIQRIKISKLLKRVLTITMLFPHYL